METDADSQITRTTVTDLTAAQGIGSDNLSVADVIRSRNDDPSNFDAAYIIRSDRTFVQYHKPGVGGKEPIPSADVQTWLDQNVSDMVSQVVDKTLLTDAKTNFGQ